jgi:hypothetical protein
LVFAPQADTKTIRARKKRTLVRSKDIPSSIW